MRGVLLWMTVLAASSGCAVGGFKQSLESRREPLYYSAGDAPPAAKDSTTVRVAKVAVVRWPPAVTSVQLVRRRLIPLGVYNYFNQRWWCRLGLAQIANDPEGFIREGLTEELRRTSRHPIATGTADVELEVIVTKIDSVAPVEEGADGVGLAGGMVLKDDWLKAGPVVSSIEAELVLRGREATPRRSKIVGTATVEIPLAERGLADLDRLVPALVNGLSLAIADLNRKIVEAIDAATRR